ncbi:MAG: VOC family protein [Chloroflexota bacterium]
MQKVVTTLWFDGQVQAALDLYASVFEDFAVSDVSRYPDAMPEKAGEIINASFSIGGQQFNILNGGPQFPQTPAVSLMVNCENQAEVDRVWDALIADGGEPGQCGWLKDKFGVSWQVVPMGMSELFTTGTAEQRSRAQQAMLKMSKLDLPALQAAHAGE